MESKRAPLLGLPPFAPPTLPPNAGGGGGPGAGGGGGGGGITAWSQSEILIYKTLVVIWLCLGDGGHVLCLKTRASAQRVMNTPGRHHFLIIKYFKVNDNDIRQDIVYNVSLWVTMIYMYHPKYNFPGVNILQDMKQICWAIKYRSLTNTYLRN